MTILKYELLGIFFMMHGEWYDMLHCTGTWCMTWLTDVWVSDTQWAHL